MIAFPDNGGRVSIDGGDSLEALLQPDILEGLDGNGVCPEPKAGQKIVKNRNRVLSCFPLILSFTISAFVCTNSGRKTPMLHEMATRSKSEKIDDFQVMVLCATRAHTRELAVLHAMLYFFNRNWRVGSAAMRVR